MAKTNEELNELKKRVEELNKDLAELTEEELSVVFGVSLKRVIRTKPEKHVLQD